MPTQETVTVFMPEEIDKFKAEEFSKFRSGKPKYQHPAVCILMLNTVLRTGELLFLLNSDIDLEYKYLEVRKGVKEVCKITSQITEMCYVKKNTTRLQGITDGFNF